MNRSCVPSGARWMHSGVLFGVVLVAVGQAELGGHGEVHLVGGQREFAADDAPDLHVNLRAVKRRFVRHLDVVDAADSMSTSRTMSSVLIQSSGSLTYFLPRPSGDVRAEAHDVFLDAENLEILQIHLVDRVELLRELLRRAINVRVVHVERADAHEAEQFARLLVAIAGAVFGEAQRQIAITARFRRKNAVMMRAVHGFEVITFCSTSFRIFMQQF